MASFSKADAKVRTFFWTTKTFQKKFSKKVFFKRWFKTLTSFQYFNSSAFLSRKRVQNYCFTAYPPNIRNTFLLTFEGFYISDWFTNMLYNIKRKEGTCRQQVPYLIKIYTRACMTCKNYNQRPSTKTQLHNFSKKSYNYWVI